MSPKYSLKSEAALDLREAAPVIHQDAPSGDPPILESVGTIEIRRPTTDDAADMWRLAETSGVLDSNSPYAYLMMGRWFSDTCLVATQGDKLVGFVVGFVLPRQPETMFVWQIGVDASARGCGLGGRMLQVLADACPRGVRFLEATVTPSNRASESLFRAFARRRGVLCAVSNAFPSDVFPKPGHESERLFRIGPLRHHQKQEKSRGNF